MAPEDPGHRQRPAQRLRHGVGHRDGQGVRAVRSEGGRGRAACGFPIVGIGASAGGLDAFNLLLSQLPADSGCGVLSRTWTSTEASPQALGKATTMPVTQAKNRDGAGPPRYSFRR